MLPGIHGVLGGIINTPTSTVILEKVTLIPLDVPPFSFLFFLYLETGFHCVALTFQELTL